MTSSDLTDIQRLLSDFAWHADRGDGKSLGELFLQHRLFIFRRILQLVLEPLDLFIQARLFLRIGFDRRLRFRTFFRRYQQHQIALLLVQLDARPRIARAVEDPVERVVIRRGDGIKLVIVTTGAVD